MYPETGEIASHIPAVDGMQVHSGNLSHTLTVYTPFVTICDRCNNFVTNRENVHEKKNSESGRTADGNHAAWRGNREQCGIDK